MVDLARIAIYGVSFYLVGLASPFGPEQWRLIASGSGAAFAGVMIGKRFLHKITMETVQKLTGMLLAGLAFALGAGLI